MVEDLDCFSPVIDQEEESEEVHAPPVRKQRHYKPWNQEEDDRLRVLAPQYAFDWTGLTQYFAGKSAACLRRRWDFKHNPNMKRGPWTKEEDQTILRLKEQLGGGYWKIIAQSLPGRAPDSIKNRYYSVLHRNSRKKASPQRRQNGHNANSSESSSDPDPEESTLEDVCALLSNCEASVPPLAAEDQRNRVWALQATLDQLVSLLVQTKAEMALLREELADPSELNIL